MKPGIYENLSNEEYHGDKDAVSKSGLDLIAKSPAHFKWAQDNPRSETPAMQKGTLIHTMVLEPEKVGELYAVPPNDAPKRPSITQRQAKKPSDKTIAAIEFWDRWEAENGGKILLGADLYEDAKRIVAAVHANPEAMRIGS